MTIRFVALSACVLALGVGCGSDDSPSTTADTGTATTDTGAGTTDTGTGTTDTGTSETAGETGAAPTCEAYCTANLANCTGAKNAQYPDKAICMAICAKMTVGSAGDMAGDTIGCRLYHSNAAPTAGVDVHCPHSGMTGGKTCGTTRCDAFCKLAWAQCEGKPSVPFTSEADCKAKCPEDKFSSTAAGGELDQMKGTLNCMQYHLQAAYATPTHCQHLTITQPGPCTP